MHSSRSLPRLRVLHTRSYAVTANVRPPLSGLSQASRTRAEKLSAEGKGTSATGDNPQNFIGGAFVESKANDWIDVVDPVRTLSPRTYATTNHDTLAGIPDVAHPRTRNHQRRVRAGRLLPSL